MFCRVDWLSHFDTSFLSLCLCLLAAVVLAKLMQPSADGIRAALPVVHVVLATASAGTSDVRHQVVAAFLPHNVSCAGVCLAL